MGRLARLPSLRAVALSVLAGLCLVGCGAGRASSPSPHRFVACQLGPPWPLAVSGGSIAALSVEGITCAAGVREMTSMLAALAAGRGANGRPLRGSGWSCVSYERGQATCVRDAATVYGQYGLS